MKNVSRSLRWIAVLVLLIEAPATALGQMEIYESPFGTDPTQMNGSCEVCQQAAGEPDWFDPSYAGFETAGFETAGFETAGFDADRSVDRGFGRHCRN